MMERQDIIDLIKSYEDQSYQPYGFFTRKMPEGENSITSQLIP
ncbi:hypothetical protein [Legionella brunensis]|nr:hypothetical protein [Legionella brunensis]